MFDKLLGNKREIPKPAHETKAKIVSTERFNNMIDYYTNELKSRLTELDDLKKQNEVLIKASIRSAGHADQFRIENSKLKEELRKLQEKNR
jgi:hypothetical protein